MAASDRPFAQHDISLEEVENPYNYTTHPKIEQQHMGPYSVQAQRGRSVACPHSFSSTNTVHTLKDRSGRFSYTPGVNKGPEESLRKGIDLHSSGLFEAPPHFVGHPSAMFAPDIMLPESGRLTLCLGVSCSGLSTGRGIYRSEARTLQHN